MEHLIGARVDDETMYVFDSAARKVGLSRSEALREAIDLFINHAKGMKVIEMRDVSKSKAKKEIRTYLKERGSAWTGEISDELRIDFELVSKCVDELIEEKKIT